MPGHDASDTTVRSARVEDAAAIARIHVEAWRWAYEGLVDAGYLAGLDVESRTGNWQRALASGSANVRVAERDGRVVGFVVTGPSRDEARDDGAPASTGELRAIYIEPALERTGVGAALMVTALADLAAAGFSEATLWVLDTNARGRTFYERGGWRPDGAVREEKAGPSTLRELRYRRVLG